jgi:hypothetical protein
MPNKSAFSTLTAAWVAVLSLILLLYARSARGQISSANYTFVVASGFLCDSGDSGNCPAIAKSANGDRYEISGAGTFDPQNKSVKAAGTFNHKSTNGNVLETGVWTASDLISFDSYGTAPARFMHGGPAFGGPQTGYKPLPMRSGPLATGGLAIFHVLLTPVSGTTKTAVLQVNWALGKVPDERQVEGVRLAFKGGGATFDEEVGGSTLFLLTRQGTGTVPKNRQPPGGDQNLPPSEPKPRARGSVAVIASRPAPMLP